MLSLKVVVKKMIEMKGIMLINNFLNEIIQGMKLFAMAFPACSILSKSFL